MRNNKKKTNETMDVVFLIDRSGSMYSLTEETIGGYNGYLDSLKGKDVNITTVLFNTYCEMIEERTPLKDVKSLDGIYHAMGGTALYDAIGKTIKRLEKNNPEKVLFVINTDGYENSSTIFSSKDVRKMIAKHSDWEFIFLGADIDTMAETSKIGIDSKRSINYSKTESGVRRTYGALSKISSKFFEEEEFNDEWLCNFNEKEENETKNDKKAMRFKGLDSFIKRTKKDK